MLQGIQTEAQCEWQGLALLHGQQSAGCASRESAIHRGEQRFGHATPPVELTWKRLPHLVRHSPKLPILRSTLSEDHTSYSEFRPVRSVVARAVELGTRRPRSHVHLLGSPLRCARKARAVGSGIVVCPLRRQKLVSRICHEHPLRPMSPGQRSSSVIIQATHKAAIDCHRCEASGIVCFTVHLAAGGRSPPSLQPLRTRPCFEGRGTSW